ncbi:outer membrane protein transport protein [Pseudomonas sp. Y39-6]|uniref:OmpP1/FadL family transporter n=1 Tax=Pseudomonas sp. Y39-6 TaxID=2749807 RepID=UPI00202D015A|nr:outer membrane protein transport protein [Pseudomonas sp. Y39-6]URS59071.1 outer membrane protein transport protein [Pseudomonas sp. Y39-6]
MNQGLIRAITIAISATASQATLASSDVFRFVGYGPVSSAMGGAATAFDVGAAGMMTNPATLSLMAPGSEIHLGLDVIVPDLSVKNQATGETASSNDHSKNRGPYAAPQLAFTYRGGPWAFGLGVFAQGGVGTEYGTKSFLSRATGGLDTGLENSSRLLTLNIPFAASYEVNDRLTVGASVDAVWQGLNLDMLMGADQLGSLIGAGRVSGSLVPVLGELPDLRGAHLSFTKNQPVASGADAWGVGGRIGMIYKITQATIFGAAYSMESKLADMEGNATLTAVDAVVGQVALAGKIKIRDFQTPAQLNLGISHQLNDQWLIAADVSRIFWKHAMKDIDVDFVADNGSNINILLPQNYRDQTALSFGAAYQTGKWTLRGGGRLATQALRSDTVLAVIPAIPTTFGSAGFSYQFTRASKMDFAWIHSFKKEMDNSSQPNTSEPIRVAHAQDSISTAYVYEF